MNKNNKIRAFINEASKYACLLVLVITFIFAGLLAPNFFTELNIMNILKQSSVVCTVAIGMGIILVSGCMDMTVGVNMAICAIVCMYSQTVMSVTYSIVLTLLVGLLISLINFSVVTITKADATDIMMITFGLKMAYRGIAQFVTGNVTYRFEMNQLFNNVGKGQTGFIPNIAIVMIVLLIIVAIIMSFTKFGREVICIGNNIEASELSGIESNKVRLKCFIISGICCAIAGILLASRTQSVNALSGDGYEMDAMCGLIIGGYSVSGGYGNAWRAIVGVFVYSSIKNVLNLLGVSSYGQELAQGIILLIAVWIDIYIKGKKLKIGDTLNEKN